MLIKICIENYLSIKNRQELKINNTLTTLIGKNESGKTSILKAIEKLNYSKKINDDEKNVNLRKKPSLIKAYYKLTGDEVKSVNKEIKNKDNIEKFLIIPEDNGDFYYSCEINDKNDVRYYSYYKMNNNNKLDEITNMYYIKIEDKMIKYLKSLCSSSEEEKILNDILKQKKSEMQSRLENYNNNELNDKLLENLQLYTQTSSKYLIELLPTTKYIMMSSFKDIIRDNIKIDEAEESTQALNVLKLADIEIDELREAFDSENCEILLQDYQEKYVDIVSEKFKKIFKQADKDFKLKVRFGSRYNDITFLTQDNTSGSNSISLSKRSDGFRWYLSLYLSLYNYLNNLDDNKYILLLDEPNLYLHPAAQKDLLTEVFENEFKDIQIIFSTHSPYMINPDNSFSIRIIEKDDETRIYNNAREYSLKKGKQDVDTITPILMAIGIDISNNLVIDTNNKIIITEGLQDVYILRAFVSKLKLNKDFQTIKFISATGVSKIGIMFSYLFGMGYNVYALFDEDKAGREEMKRILDVDDSPEIKNRLFSYKIAKEKEKDVLLESLFSESDKKKHLLTKSTIIYKNIYDNSDDKEFDEETKGNFAKILNYILKLD